MRRASVHQLCRDFLLLAAACSATTAAAQETDPRPNECWGFVFGAWTPALDWRAAGHTTYTPHVATPPSPEAATTGGAPRHDAAHHGHQRGPTLVLYPTWWPVGVAITLDTDAAVGDTVRGIAHALVADGRTTAPKSRILAWKKPCTEPVSSLSRAESDEPRSPREAPAAAPPPRSRARRPR